jgi:transposase
MPSQACRESGDDRAVTGAMALVERTFAWLNQFRGLRVRYEKRADIHEAFLSLGCALICWCFLRAEGGGGKR